MAAPEIERRDRKGLRPWQVDKGCAGIRRMFKRGLGQAFLLVALPDITVFCPLHKLLSGAGMVSGARLFLSHVQFSLPIPCPSRLVRISVRATARLPHFIHPYTFIR